MLDGGADVLSVNNLDEFAKLQASLAAEGRAVSLEYVLAVPALVGGCLLALLYAGAFP